jgi:hypothetical protein
MSVPRSFWILVVFVVGAGFVPFRALNCPVWDVWVTDQKGMPVSGITVRLTYRNYSAEPVSHEIDAVTDARGHVEFGARTLSASFFSRFVSTISCAMGGTHASFGPHAWVFAFGGSLEGLDIDKRRNVVVDWTGKPDHMESRIVVGPRL